MSQRYLALTIRMTLALACLEIGPTGVETARGQGQLKDEIPSVRAPSESTPQVPEKVEVTPFAHDDEIGTRLENILNATGWFTEPNVRVDEGVVFLEGHTASNEYQQWAGELARNTQDVAAVVNRIDVTQSSIWSLQPAWKGFATLQHDFLEYLPFIGFGLIVLLLSYISARIVTSVTRRVSEKRIHAMLLREVVARSAGLILFLFGLYIVLRVSGLTRLALTVVGGTGILGLVIGIAFRDITENFLASIFLSMQRPFQVGDLVEIAGVQGYVQQLTVRTTVLMNLTGNHVQIPNATVYKSIIRNFTSNPNRREDFTIGIGHNEPITDAQSSALEVLQQHEAVLKEPEPWVLVDSLGSATVNLRIYFWVDGSQHSSIKVKSSVIRLVKRAFLDRKIAMPDDAREIVFPQGLPVRLIELPKEKSEGEMATSPQPKLEPEIVSTQAEAGLESEAGQIQEQARKSRPPEESENLLDGRR